MYKSVYFPIATQKISTIALLKYLRGGLKLYIHTYIHMYKKLETQIRSAFVFPSLIVSQVK